MVPARRLYLLLLLGLAIAPILATAIGPGPSGLILLGFDSFLLFLTLVDGLQVKPSRLQIWRATLGRLSINRDNPVIIEVHSAVFAKLQVCDDFPPSFPVSQSLFALTLEAGASQSLIYTVRPDQRGQFHWGNLRLRQLSPWGLAWRQWQVPASELVTVYPDLIGLRALSIRLSLENSGNLRQARRLAMGTEFAELREYRQGDDVRLVDWKATARRIQPVVRVLEPEQEQTLIILLDRGRLMTAQVQGLQRFDWGLNATLSLALTGLSRQDRVGVGVFDREIAVWVPPERGQPHLGKLLDKLAPLQPVLLESDYLGAVTRLVNQQTRRALVVLITDIVDSTASAELLTALSRLTPRYLPFCVTLRDAQIDRLAQQPPSEEPELGLYERAVALDLLAQRQVAFAQLRQRGVLVLDAPGDRLSDELVERYLQLKSRSLGGITVWPHG